MQLLFLSSALAHSALLVKFTRQDIEIAVVESYGFSRMRVRSLHTQGKKSQRDRKLLPTYFPATSKFRQLINLASLTTTLAVPIPLTHLGWHSYILAPPPLILFPRVLLTHASVSLRLSCRARVLWRIISIILRRARARSRIAESICMQICIPHNARIKNATGNTCVTNLTTRYIVLAFEPHGGILNRSITRT